MSTTLNKQTLKQEIIKISDGLEKMTGNLMSPGCSDDETGILRARAYTAMSKLHDELKKMICQIY